jgi:hypothetical protein
VTDKNLRARVEALTNGIAYAMARAPVPTATTTAREYAASLAPLVIESGFLDQPAPPDTALREAARKLADEAARAVAEPRRFHENEDDRQQQLGSLVALVRMALATAPTPPVPNNDHMPAPTPPDTAALRCTCGAAREYTGDHLGDCPMYISVLDQPAPPDTALLRQTIANGVVAMRLTREYVGEETLPAIEGWSWFDWTKEAEAALAATAPTPPDEPMRGDHDYGINYAPPDTALREALDAAVESAMRDLSGTNEELRTVEEAFQVGVGAGIAKMRRAVEALHDRYEETGMMTGHSAAWDMKDLLRLAATAPTPPDGLDAAWREAEAALPEGWWIEKVYLRERGTYLETYSAWARRPDSDGGLRGDGATPTAALRSLADAFRAAAPPEPAP